MRHRRLEIPPEFVPGFLPRRACWSFPDTIAKIYDPIMKPLDAVGFRDWRRWAVRRAHGRVLEIGVGTGLNLEHYPSASHLVAVDPDAEMLVQIESRNRGEPRSLLVQARAEDLPFEDRSFDAAVGTLVFCTIPDPNRALCEVARVLKSGASLRLVEHVRAKNPALGSLMDLATPLWKRIAGGCHLNRNTVDLVRSQGFIVISTYKRWRGLLVGIDAERQP